MLLSPDDRLGDIIALPHNRPLKPLMDLPDDTGYTYPWHTQRGRWPRSRDNPYAEVQPRRIFRRTAIPTSWTKNLEEQVERLIAYCGPIDETSISDQIAGVASHQNLIAERFGNELAKRTVYLALAGPGLFHQAALRHYNMDFPGHGDLIERLVFDFLRRQISPRTFNSRLGETLSDQTLSLGTDYRGWLERLPTHSVRVTALVAPFAGMSLEASRFELRQPTLETRSFVEVGTFVIAQLIAQLPEVVKGAVLVGQGEKFALRGEMAKTKLSPGTYLDDRTVQTIANENTIGNSRASGVLAIL